MRDCFEEEDSYWLRKENERRSPLFFEEAEEIREIQRREKFWKRVKTEEKENHEERERKIVSQREKRTELLIETLKWKIWQKLDIKSRYPKRECVKIDLVGKEDAKIVSELFGESESFSLFYCPPPFSTSTSSSCSSSTSAAPLLKHQMKFIVWRVKILSEEQMEPWFASLLRCYKMRHYAEVQFHSGVLTASPTPMEVCLCYSRVISWITSDCLGREVIEKEIKSCSTYYLKVSFKVSSSKISYSDSDSQ